MNSPNGDRRRQVLALYLICGHSVAGAGVMLARLPRAHVGWSALTPTAPPRPGLIEQANLPWRW